MTENIENINNDLTLNAALGNLGGVKYLLENGADIYGRDSGGDTALICAVSSGRSEMAKYLLSKIEKGKKDYLDAKDIYGFSALMYASNKKLTDIAECLIEKGADINTKDKNGWTPLIWASKGGDLELVKLLIEKGANINEENNDGWTALMFASYSLHLELVKLLIEKGADIDTKDKNGWTVLMYVSTISNSLKIEIPSIESEEYIIAKNNGSTFIWDLFKHNVKLVEYLIKNGADIDAKNNNGDTALDLAKNKEIKKLLEEAKRDKNQK